MLDRRQGFARKKLIEAGYHWADSQPHGEDGLDEDAVYFDIPAHHFDDKPEPFYVDHKNWPFWLIFLDCNTQWRYKEGRPVALDYAAVKAVIELHNPNNHLKTFHAVRLIEQGVRAKLQGIELENLHGTP